MNDTYEYEKDDEDENGDANDGDDETGEKNNDLSKPDGDKVNFKGDELFKSVQMPNSLYIEIGVTQEQMILKLILGKRVSVNDWCC